MLEACGVGLFTLVTVFIGWGLLLDGGDFAAHHRSVAGIVIAVREQVNCSGTSCSTIYVTTIRYPVGGGLQLTFKADRDHQAAIGDRLQVHYAVGDPHDARLDTGRDERTAGVVLIALGLCAVPVYLAAAGWRRRRGRVH